MWRLLYLGFAGLRDLRWRRGDFGFLCNSQRAEKDESGYSQTVRYGQSWLLGNKGRILNHRGRKGHRGNRRK